VLLLLPANFFDQGQSICLSILLINQSCFGCGITRAIQHMIHFDFIAAYSYNKLSFIVLPIIIFFYVGEIVKTYNKIYPKKAV
jgi:hypothetical protein